ncbi:glycine zipper 2TM domain-containing protein [Undibacterium arcticum]|uniref:Glycine zipper 2TM domain-containing protein n=1 Tax=Undibacterium arcticum TaxID=1762892 RepID=A0ABV7F123_9BURK
MNKHKIVGIALLAGSALLTGCADTGQPASQPYNQPYSQPASPAQGSYPTSSQNYASGYGVIEAIDVAPAASSSPVNAGTVLGGVVGGLLGNQVGSGSGRTAATVAGAVGGAVVGNQIEKSRTAPSQAYQIRVRLDNGSYQTVAQDDVGDLRVGNRVRIENNRVYRY